VGVLSWPPFYVYLATACVVMIATGQLLFKITANSLQGPGFLGANPKALAILFVALAIYGVATIAWILVLRQAPLNRIYPLMALSFVLVPLGSRFVLGETITPQYWTGVALLVAGLILIGRSGAPG
jgi:drug/metabolite transporter (DMT)-like permease